MAHKPKTIEKLNLHLRNKHRGRYDFKVLNNSCPELAPFVFVNEHGDESIDFANPDAVKMLNRALLKHFYGIEYWDIPENYLCPPIPGRADYIHYLADLIAYSNQGKLPEGNYIRCLDIGVGANCVYPIIGHQEYGWNFVGTDIDLTAIESAEKIVINNPDLKKAVELQDQSDADCIFRGIIEPTEFFDLTLCNPPFHSSAEEAMMSSVRKVSNLKGENISNPVLNFGGQSTELWYEGGEVGFIQNMIEESKEFAKNCFWFTTLVSKKTNLPEIYKALQDVQTAQVKTINMAQGQKTTRFVAWSFLDKDAQKEWRKSRWAEIKIPVTESEKTELI
jgi:23S rRNA (adenine1618-N6)-methyltransferase